MDQEFDKIVENMPDVDINNMAAMEHVGGIQHAIRFVKERCRGTWAVMLFEQIQKLYVIHMVYFCVVWMNLFPPVQGISKKLYPR